ncbi:MAG: hypothetical protein IIT48_08750 [Lachnospiraceae bacterium]|nr:hypothetical protein [Lachnospiraceae bacterium]
MKLLFPWNYDQIVRSYLQEDKKIMDYDTGGAEYLLSLYEGTIHRYLIVAKKK